MNAQHAGLSAERWSRFDFGRQLLMIANELNRAAKLTAEADRERRRSSLERVLALADLTVAVNDSPSRRRELLRWREIAGGCYLETDPQRDRALLRALLLLHPQAASQIPFVAG